MKPKYAYGVLHVVECAIESSVICIFSSWSSWSSPVPSTFIIINHHNHHHHHHQCTEVTNKKNDVHHRTAKSY